MKKSLKIILEGLIDYRLFGQKQIYVTGISQDSNKIKKGYLFFAVKGQRFDGHDFIDKAIENGSTVVVGEKEPKNKWLYKISYIKVANSRKALGKIASNWFGNPSKKLKVIGVTGTDGKTTTAFLIYHILKSAGINTGLVSTVSARIGEKEFETGLHVTSPDPISLQRFLAAMVNAKCEYAVVEVTSHGLDQERVFGVHFDVGVLTNITHEHLDYHKNFLNYLNTKAKLFKRVKTAILNKDDGCFEEIRCVTPSGSSVLSYSVENNDADVLARNISETDFGTEFDVVFWDGGFHARTQLLGKYNISNVLAAVTLALDYELPVRKIQYALQTFIAPAGRLQKLKESKQFDAYIDFAHTPNSLENVLNLLRKKAIAKGGNLITVFGCAGERDIAKRSIMGEISGRLSDISVFTAEDPRSERVENIIEEMVKGALKSGTKEISIDAGEKIKKKSKKHLFVRIPERGEAISFVVQKLAQKKDIVVICGKGHEKSMAYDGVEHPWSDHDVVKNTLLTKKDVSAIVLAAGLGTRMRSRLPKVLHEIAGRPMLAYALQNLRAARIDEVVVVAGYRKDLLKKRIGGAVKFAIQNNPKGGTAQATNVGLNKVSNDVKSVLVLYGDDSAFYQPETIIKVLRIHDEQNSVITFVTLLKNDPAGLGRIVRDKSGRLAEIIEEKDATEAQRKIKEVNDGLYVFDKNWLIKNLLKVVESPVTGEYYLVDLIKIALKYKEKVKVFKLMDDSQWYPVSTREHLDEADRKMRKILSETI